MSAPLLTIAFPTYKRPHRIADSVIDTLKNDSKDIEVIVCDNSEDYLTKDKLENIKDERFSYHRNGKNLGFCGNFKQCIMNANGSFVLIVSDEDRINHSALDDILRIIKKQNLAHRGGQQQNANMHDSNQITEIISGVAYIENQDRWYITPPKNKNAHLSSKKTKNHPLYKLLRSYISGFLFNTKIAKYIYNNKIKDFEDTETYFYYPFWIIGWLSLEFGGAYTYNSKPLILKTQNDNSNYIGEGIGKKVQKVFSFASELECFVDKMKLSKDDTICIKSSLDAHSIYYIKTTTLRYDTSISWDDAYKQLLSKLKENRKYPYFSIIHFYYLSALMRAKAIIKRLIGYKQKYKT